MTGPGSDPVDALAARVAQLADDVEALQAAVAAGAGVVSEPDGAGPAPLYATVEDWVGGFFTAAYPRPVGGDLRWCRQWFAHPEALIRLEALWRAWEVYRRHPLGAVDWHHVLDHHLPVLFSDRGPFAGCTPQRHEPPGTLPVVAPPAGWWDLAGPGEAPPGRDGTTR